LQAAGEHVDSCRNLEPALDEVADETDGQQAFGKRLPR
jgi:hypothetical protein